MSISMKKDIQKDDNFLDFEYMYETYKNKIWLIICKYLADKQLREEVLQDVFRIFDMNIEIFDNEEGAVKWLKTVTYNKIKDYNRKTKARKKYFDVVSRDDENLEEYSASPETETQNIIIGRENISEISKAIHELKPIYRDVIYWVYYVEWTPKEISAKYDIPLNTVYSRLKKARDILREKNELKILKGRVDA